MLSAMRGRLCLSGVLALTLITSACGGGSETTATAQGTDTTAAANAEPVRIAYFNVATANTYAQASLEGIQDAATKFNATMKDFDGAFDATKQYAQLQDALTSGDYDAFIINAVDGNGVVPAIQDAIDKGIKVACITTPCGPDAGTIKAQIPGMVAQVGNDFTTETGMLLGQLTGEACNGKNPCETVFFVGARSYANDVTRLQAFREKIKEYPNIKLVDVREGKYLSDPSFQAFQDVLQAHPGIDVFVSAGDQMTLGAERAAIDAGKEGQIAFIGTAASKPGVEAVRAGRWFATTAAYPYTEGYEAARLVIAAARGETGLPTSVNTIELNGGASVVTAENAGEFKPQWAG